MTGDGTVKFPFADGTFGAFAGDMGHVARIRTETHETRPVAFVEVANQVIMAG